MSNHATKKVIKDAKGVDTPNLAAKSDFITLKVEFDKLDINKLVTVLTSLNNLFIKGRWFRCW